MEQQWEFVGTGVARVTPRLMSDADLVKRLPAAARVQYQKVSSLRKKAADLEQAGEAAMMASFFGHASAAKAKYKLASSQASRARLALSRGQNRATDALEKMLAKKPSGEIGLALSRLYERGAEAREAPQSRSIQYGELSTRTGDGLALAPLRTAVEATSPSSELGRFVRLELVYHLMSTNDARDAFAILPELIGASPPDQRPLLIFYTGVLHALDGKDAAAADDFRRAHEGLAVSSGISRSDLLSAELVARYRAGQFERALGVASENWTERANPAPLAPDPMPPPPPPTPKTKRGAKAIGMLEALSANSLWAFGSSAGLSESDVLRLATDAVERLHLDPSTVQGPVGLRAGIFSRLAVRALYRNDDDTAKTHAEAARALAQPASRDAIRVLQLLSRRAGDDDAAKDFAKEAEALPYGLGKFGSDPELAYLEVELRGQKATATPAPPAERNVRSLLRLCIEPLHQHLPKTATIDNKFVATVELDAKVYEKGRVELQALPGPTTAKQSGLVELAACLKQMGPRVLAKAPSSVDAAISIAQLTPRSSGFGEGLDAFGTIGIGGGSGIGGFGSGSSLRERSGVIGGLIGVGDLGVRGPGAGSGIVGGKGKPTIKKRAPVKKAKK